MIKKYFDKEKEYLNTFFEGLDYSSLQELIETLASCKGLIFLSGVGKSGLIAEKISVTMASTGTRAFYLSPGNALHGDIGIVKEGDIFLMLSKSGESDELVNLFPFLRNKRVQIISITANPRSRVAKASDITVAMPKVPELCPFDMVPTTSTAMQMIIGDVLAIALMEKRRLSLDQYAMNHPAGRIGKRITFKVKDLMLSGQDIPVAKPEQTLIEVLVELSNKRCGCVLTLDDERHLLGIFTDGDLRRALQTLGTKALETPMKELATNTPRSVSSEELAWDALKVMEVDQKHPVMVLPVMDEEKKVVGIIKMHDIIQTGI